MPLVTVLIYSLKVWDFVLLKDDQGLVTGTSGSDLQVWSIAFADQVSRLDISLVCVFTLVSHCAVLSYIIRLVRSLKLHVFLHFGKTGILGLFEM